jgi:trans-aconitate methyltransferase
MDVSATARGRTGLIYRDVRLYRLSMWLLYRGERDRERELVVGAVPPGASVVDLCCGDCSIAKPLLARNCTYLGLDVNEVFLAHGRRCGISVRYWDGDPRAIPEADVICMLSSLYQFIPDHVSLVAAMVARSRRRVIIAEPVTNWGTSRLRLLRKIAERLTRVDGKTFAERLSEDDLVRLADGLERVSATVTRLGRELVLVLDTGQASAG